MNPILHHVRRMALLQAANGPTDAELLELFLNRRDEAAFEALLRRHAPMVLGVCRRVLRHPQDAEDACQATFLVLARKAASLRSRDLLGHWLYGIALRTALKARAMNSKRRAREREVGRRARPEMPADESSEKLLARLDTEINRLPEKYRVPVVLCELQGKSRKEVATLLGLPEGTLSSRLAHARKLLARRLGTTKIVSGAVLTGVLSADISAAAPSTLLRATAKAAVQQVSGQVVRAGEVSAQVLVLTEGVMKAMFLSKLKGVGAVVLAVALGAGGVSYHQVWAQTGRRGDSSGTANSQVDSWSLRARTMADELEELRMEVAALRKGLEGTRERVKIVEHRLDGQGRSNGPGGAVMGSGAGPQGLMSNGGAGMGTKPGGRAGVMQGGPPGGAGMMPSTGDGAGMMRAPETPPGGMKRGGPPGNAEGTSTGSSNPMAAKGAVAGSSSATGVRGGGAFFPPSGQPSLSNLLPDPLSSAEAALKKLRENPDDMQALHALEQALQAIRSQKPHSEELLGGVRH
jgi:RNA polymerase sigma factor (sigma-70 family)